MLASKVQTVLLIGSYTVYVVMGALVFELLEHEHHKKLEEEMFLMKKAFCMNYTSLSQEELEDFIKNVVRAVRSGIELVGDHPHERHRSWDFANSFFFVGTALATIGYGNLCPQTVDGQLFCVIFAVFGIPFNLICLNRIGFFVAGACRWCAENVYENAKRKTARNVTFFLVLGNILFLFLPAAIFHMVEGWSYSEAIYFTFITLSTIGFGDYRIGRKRDRTYFRGYRLLAATWIVFGLAWISVLFDLVTSVMKPIDERANLPTSLEQN